MGVYNPTAAHQAWDRNNFQILASGFSYGLMMKSAFNLKTRKFVPDDWLIAFALGCWFIYVTLMTVNVWTSSTTGAIPNYNWVIAAATVPYTFTMCSILFSSFNRFMALNEVESKKQMFERVRNVVVGVILILRLLRTVFIFISSTDPNITNAFLTPQSTAVQIASLFPFLFIRTCLDCYSLHKLINGRLKFTLVTSKHVVQKAQIYIIVEIILGISALIIAFEENLNLIQPRAAFFDWNFISWCMLSWVDQRSILRKLFGEASRQSTTISASGKNESEPSGIGSGINYYTRKESTPSKLV